METSIAIKAYAGEKYERSKMWRIVFFTIVGLLVLTSLIMTWFGGILEIFVIGLIVSGYIFFSIFMSKPITLKLTKEGVWAGKELMPWNELAWFVVEMDMKDEKVKNIVFVFVNWAYKIFGVDDADIEDLRIFLEALSQILPRLWGFEQSFVDKIARLLKI